ncbi:hypothetical protein PILCRDRAFT_85796 [Piloderma croceum F 1598]|uniref:Uncharacterized protein n=1 Tax=Piloderma croceum (strain F 1598) TaxID=765440 RepID=A0A0C3FUJ7_PILCF|nr:hypothetical protein PILCRDRAFT_85796 [Piloderma croceum F 1598]
MLAPKSVCDTPFNYTKTEGDIAVAVEYQLVNPVWQIAQQWLPQAAQYSFTKNFKWGLEVLNEAYSKKNTATSENEEYLQQGTLRTQTEAMFTGISTANQYLECEEIWGMISSSKVANSKQGEICIEKMDHVKSLVPIEIKDHGYINEKCLSAMARLAHKIGGSDKTAIGGVLIAGIRVILQQAVHYATHYGTTYVFLSHYCFSLLLKLDEVNLLTSDVQWAVVDTTDTRVALAYALWCACNDLKDELARTQMEELKQVVKAGQDWLSS